MITPYTFERTYDILHDYLMEADYPLLPQSHLDELLEVLKSRGCDPTQFKYIKHGKMSSCVGTLDSPRYFPYDTPNDEIGKCVKPVADYCDKIDETYLPKRPVELDQIWAALDIHIGESMLDKCQFDNTFNVSCPEYYVPIETLDWVGANLRKLNAKMVESGNCSGNSGGCQDGVLMAMIKNDQKFDRLA